MVNPFSVLGDVFDMLRRARARQPLTPAERAILRAVAALWQTGVAAGVVAILTAFMQNGQPLTYSELAQVGAVAAATAMIAAVAKFITAHGDPQSAPVRSAIAQELSLTAQQLEARYGGRANAAKRPA